MFHLIHFIKNVPRPSLCHNGASFSRLALCLVCLFFLPAAWAVDPPPDGGYPNGNTAEGDDALFSLTNDGLWNTAVGFQALYSNTNGIRNTAVGYISFFFEWPRQHCDWFRKPLQ